MFLFTFLCLLILLYWAPEGDYSKQPGQDGIREFLSCGVEMPCDSPTRVCGRPCTQQSPVCFRLIVASSLPSFRSLSLSPWNCFFGSRILSFPLGVRGGFLTLHYMCRSGERCSGKGFAFPSASISSCDLITFLGSRLC